VRSGRPWHFHLIGFSAVAVAVCVILFHLPLALFFAAALVLLASSLGGWALERKQRRPDS
jgi:hypothetical protein